MMRVSIGSGACIIGVLWGWNDDTFRTDGQWCQSKLGGNRATFLRYALPILAV